MKAVFVITDISYGGGLTYLKHVLQAKVFTDVTVMTMVKTSRQKEICELVGVDHEVWSFKSYWALRNQVFIFNSLKSVLFSLPLTFFVKRCLYVSHGMGNGIRFMPWIRRFLYALVLANPKLELISCGDDEFLSNSKYKKHGHWLVRNGIDFQSSSRPPSRASHLESLVFFGRVSRQKGFDILLKSLKDKPIRLRVYGDWESVEFKRNCEKFIETNNLEVDFYGYRPLSSVDFREGSCFVMPSRFEGLPYSVLEIANKKLPLIISSCAGHRELLCDGDSLWFKTENAADLSRVFSTLDPSSLVKSIEARYEHAKRYNLEAFKQELDYVFS